MASIILPDFSKLRIAVVGDAIMDRYIYGEITRISPEAPVPIFTEKLIEHRHGGASNVLNNVYALGALGQLYAKPNERWPIKTRYVAGTQQVFRSDDEHNMPFDILALDEADFIIVSDYAKGVITPLTMETVRRSGKPFIVDPKGTDWAKYKGARVITPNEVEYLQIQGRDWTVGSADIVMTRGNRGCDVWQSATEKWTPVPTEPLIGDVTGAGDTFIAALGCCLASGMDLLDAARVANAAAGISVSKRGTAICTRDELVAAL